MNYLYCILKHDVTVNFTVHCNITANDDDFSNYNNLINIDHTKDEKKNNDFNI